MKTSSPRIVALLPMKAHSERIAGKNFRQFNGKPLFRWVLDSLLEVDQITEIVINTDARSILAEHGLTDGARIRIRDRKPALCGDFVSMNHVLADDVLNVKADVYAMTHTTNPLLSTQTIKAALDAFLNAEKSDQADSLFTTNRIQTRLYRADASAVNHDPDNLIRTQDLEPWFEENSNLYVFTERSFKATGARIGKRPMMFDTPRMESFDIDDWGGWNLAEVVSKYGRPS